MSATIIPFPHRYPHSHDATARVIHIPAVEKSGEGERPEREGEREPEWITAERAIEAHTARVRALLLADLGALAVPHPDELLDRYEWARIAEGLCYVETEIQRTGRVRSPGGLLYWWLRHKTGRAVFA